MMREHCVQFVANSALKNDRTVLQLANKRLMGKLRVIKGDVVDGDGCFIISHRIKNQFTENAQRVGLTPMIDVDAGVGDDYMLYLMV